MKFILCLCFAVAAQAATILPSANPSCNFGTGASCPAGSITATQLAEGSGVSGVRYSTTAPLTMPRQQGANLAFGRLFISTSSSGVELPANQTQIPVSVQMELTANGSVNLESGFVRFAFTGQTSNGIPLAFGETFLNFNQLGLIDLTGAILLSSIAPGQLAVVTVSANTEVAYTGDGTVTLSAPQSFYIGANQTAPTSGVPEPGSLALSALGLVAVGMARRRARG